MGNLRKLNIRDSELGKVSLELGENDLKLRFTDLPQPKQLGSNDLSRIRNELEFLSVPDIPTYSLRNRLTGVLDHHIRGFGGGGKIAVSDVSPVISFGLQSVYDERISNALSNMLKGHSFVLVGEQHDPEQDPQRYAVAKSLPRLRSEGLTHVAVELGSDMQGVIDGFDYSSPGIRDDLKALNIVGWSDGNLEVVIAAKKAGLKVLCIDQPPKPGEDIATTENAGWHNKRDRWMQKVIDRELAPKWMGLKKILGRDASPDGKILILVGSCHLPRRSAEEDVDYFHYRKHVTRIGARLIKKYGRSEVDDTKLEYYGI